MNESQGGPIGPEKPVESDSVPVQTGLPRPFSRSLFFVVVMWGFAAGALIAIVAASASDHIQVTVLISLLSGMVAIVAMVPGLVSEWTTPARVDSGMRTATSADWTGPLFAGIILRLVATVALFVMCRYQLAASEQWIIALTIGWYLFLTSVEVLTLVHQFGIASQRDD